MTDRKGQVGNGPLEACLHRRLTAPKDRGPFTPSGRGINQLQGVAILARRALPAVMHYAAQRGHPDRGSSRRLGGSGNAFHGQVPRYPIGLHRRMPVQAWERPGEAGEQARD
jgi:hypothetical protein